MTPTIQSGQFEAAIDRFGLVFHDPKKLHCTRDMEIVPTEEALEKAKPCSKCYPKLYAASLGKL